MKYLRKKTVFMFTSIFLILLVVFYVMNLKAVIANITLKKDIPEFDYPGARVMVVAPHPDDESLGAAGLIRDAVKHRIPIRVVIFTSGESYKKAAILYSKHVYPNKWDFYRLGMQRQRESINAMESLGLPRKDLIFLGFADGSTKFLWDNHWDTPRRSGGVWVKRSPYPNNVYEPGIPYTGQNVVNEFSTVLNKFRPTDIYYPDPNDIHPDHWAVSNFVVYTILQQNYRIREHTYLVHHPQWPIPWLAEPKMSEQPPADLKWENWQMFDLTKDEVKAKGNALLKYKTQVEAMKPFLMGFVRKNELFGYVPPVKIVVLNRLPDLATENSYVTSKGIFGMFSQEIYRSADLVDLNAFNYRDKLWIGLTSRAPLSKKVVYQVGMRIFYKNHVVKRIDWGVINDRLVIYHRANNSIVDPSLVNMYKYRNRVWFEVSVPQYQDVKNVFMGSNALYRGNLISRIPWRVYN